MFCGGCAKCIHGKVLNTIYPRCIVLDAFYSEINFLKLCVVGVYIIGSFGFRAALATPIVDKMLRKVYPRYTALYAFDCDIKF